MGIYGIFLAMGNAGFIYHQPYQPTYGKCDGGLRLKDLAAWFGQLPGFAEQPQV